MDDTQEEKARVYLENLSDDDKAVLKSSLERWKAEGVEKPLIPTDYDVDGDGKTDSFGLNDAGELTVIFGATYDDTVAVSEGDEAVEGTAD
jgi:hypothetical protein